MTVECANKNCVDEEGYRNFIEKSEAHIINHSYDEDIIYFCSAECMKDYLIDLYPNIRSKIHHEEDPPDCFPMIQSNLYAESFIAHEHQLRDLVNEAIRHELHHMADLRKPINVNEFGLIAEKIIEKSFELYEKFKPKGDQNEEKD